MSQVKIGIAHLNTTVGDFPGNTRKILNFMENLSFYRCGFAVFQECALSGYSPEEHVTWPTFQHNQTPYLKQIVELSGQKKHQQTVYIVGGTFQLGRQAYNVAYVIAAGKIWGIVPKEKLPEYNIFFDGRVFAKDAKNQWLHLEEIQVEAIPFGHILFHINGTHFSVSICEDIWTPEVIRRHSRWGSEMEFNISASPYRMGIVETRREMLATRSADTNMIVIYTSQVGAQGGIVFDGDGYIYSHGRELLRSPRWKEGFETTVVSLEALRSQGARNTTWRLEMSDGNEIPEPLEVTIPIEFPSLKLKAPSWEPGMNRPTTSPFVPIPKSDEFSFEADIVEALIIGLGDYLEKNRFERVGINSSGGADSALVAIIAALYAYRRFADLNERDQAKAVAYFVHTFSWPTRFNSDETRSIARVLAMQLGCSFYETSIEEDVAAEVRTLKQLHPEGWSVPKLVMQNLQAEIRAKKLSIWCGANRAAFLNTSNLSEKAVGYGTKRGDMVGDLAVICDVPKTLVYSLLQYIAHTYPWLKVVPELLTTKASAELDEDQEDERELMPFEVLDQLIFLHVGERLGPAEVYQRVQCLFSDEYLAEISPGYEQGGLKEWVKKYYRLFYGNIHKWVTTPEGIHIGSIDLDRERATHLPTVSSQAWLELDQL